jgi:hypothetical protein
MTRGYPRRKIVWIGCRLTPPMRALSLSKRPSTGLACRWRLPELEHARDFAESNAICGGRSVVNAMTTELSERARTTVEGDWSSVRGGPVFVKRYEHMLLGEEGVAVLTGVDGPNSEVDLGDRSVSYADCMDLVLEGARRAKRIAGSEGEYAGFEIEGFR